MNERKLRQIVESGDTATLQTYIQHNGGSSLSQPLSAQARFAYHHLSNENNFSQIKSSISETEEKEFIPLIENYNGPNTTVIVPPKEKFNASKYNKSQFCPSKSLKEISCSRTSLSELSWVIDGNTWSNDILRHSSGFYSSSKSNEIIYNKKIPSMRRHRFFSEETNSSRPSLLTSTSSTSIKDSKKNSNLNSEITFKDNLKDKFYQMLQSFEIEEARERSKIEEYYFDFLLSARRWNYSFLDKCIKEQRDLYIAEHIRRSTIYEEEDRKFKEILSLCLDDITGCRWDGVRMQWLRTQMANALTMHEWVILQSLLPKQQQQQEEENKILNKENIEVLQEQMYEASESNTFEMSISQNDNPIHLNETFTEETSLSDTPNNEFLVETRNKPRAHHSLAVRPSRPRVIPLNASHEGCIIS